MLRTEPTLSPLGNPDTLVYMMDETIDRLLATLRQGGPMPDRKSQVTPLQRRCACGLNPLLNYYATGELAVHAVASPTCGASVDEVVSAFHAIARKEIDTLCSVCCYRHHPAAAKSQLAGLGR